MFFKNTFKQRGPKRFKYLPRFAKEDQGYHGLCFRRAFEEPKASLFDASNQWSSSRSNSRNRGNSAVTTRLLIIIFILSFIAYFILDIDFPSLKF